MKILVDVMGADKEPCEIIRGAVAALEENESITLGLVGNAEIIEKALSEAGTGRERIEIIPAADVMTMEDDPFEVVKSKRTSSMFVALRALSKGQGDALVSCGNTGALFVGSTTVIKVMPEVRRGALATILPYDPPLLLMDSGANATVNPEYYLQFAILGSAYYSAMYGVENPKVGILNNGAEEHKGTPGVVEGHAQLKAGGVNFVGNIEGKDIPRGKCHVLVTDGFTGNIVLKYSEGLAAYIMKQVKGAFGQNIFTKLAGAVMMKPLKKMKESFSSDTHGGAPILGLNKPVIKAHGSSGAKTVKAAVLQAERFASSGVLERLGEKLRQEK